MRPSTTSENAMPPVSTAGHSIAADALSFPSTHEAAQLGKNICRLAGGFCKIAFPFNIGTCCPALSESCTEVSGHSEERKCAIGAECGGHLAGSHLLKRGQDVLYGLQVTCCNVGELSEAKEQQHC